jgi:rod shape-determining protein MreD
MTPMRTRATLFIVLVTSVVAQVSFMRHTEAFPDIVLLVVVFTGIFRGRAEALAIGFLAGVLRGCFSVDTMAVDIFIFPLVGAFSSMLGGMVYRQNLAVQMFTVIAAIILLVTAHTAYLDLLAGGDIGIFSVFLRSWKALSVTVVAAPFFFAFLKWLLKLDR